MFLQRVKNSKTGAVYLYLMEVLSDKNADGRTVHRNIKIRSFGNEEKFRAEHPEEYHRLIEEYSRQGSRPVISRQKSSTLAGALEDLSSPGFLSVNGCAPTFSYALQVLRPFWNELGIEPKLAYLRRRRAIGFRLEDVVFYLASLRIIDRASALDPEEARYRFLGTYADCSSESDLISALDTVSESGSRIMRQLRDKSQSPAKGVKILFLDLSIRTESPCGTAGETELFPGLRCHRATLLPTLGAALAIDGRCMPMGFELYDWSREGFEAALPAVRELASDCGASEFVYAGDSRSPAVSERFLHSSGFDVSVSSSPGDAERHAAELFRSMAESFCIRQGGIPEPRQVHGHVTLSVVAMYMLRLLQVRLSKDGVSMGAEEISAALMDAGVAILAREGEEDLYLSTCPGSTVSAFLCGHGGIGDIMKAAGLEPLPMLCQLSDLNRCLRTRMPGRSAAIGSVPAAALRGGSV